MVQNFISIYLFIRIGEELMLGNSFNLVDVVKGYLTNNFTTRLSSYLGENNDKTQTALSGAIPGLLSGFDGAASTTDGTRRLASALDDSDETILDNLGGIFGKGFSPDSALGNLRSVLGGTGL